jgi:hypothetical protein
MEQPSIRDMVAELLELAKAKDDERKKERKHHLPKRLTQNQMDAIDLAVEELEKPFLMADLIQKANEIEPSFGNRTRTIIESVQCYLASKAGLFIRYKKQ